MISIANALTVLKEKLETELPALLIAANVSDFEVYNIGPSRDPEQRGLFLYMDSGNLDYGNNQMSLIIHLQLFTCEELEAAIYTDIVKDFIYSLDPNLLGFDLLQNIEFDGYYNVNERTAFSYIVPSWTFENSDCDVRG